MYMQLNAYAKKMPSVPQDLSMLVRWKCQQWQRYGAPSNRHIDQVLEQVQLQGWSYLSLVTLGDYLGSNWSLGIPPSVLSGASS